MAFEITRGIVDEVKEAIETGNDSFLNEILFEKHHADIAELFDNISVNEADYLLKILSNEKSAEVLVELDEELRDKLLSLRTSKEIAEIVSEHIDSDDAADVIADLPERKKEEVISLLEDLDQASDIVDLLTYDEDSAGGLMAKELIKVNQNWDVSQAVREMRKQAENVDEVYTIYVVDDKNRLNGTLSLKKMLLSSSLKDKIIDIYDSESLHYVYADMPNKEVAQIMKKYDLVVVPVVDQQMQLQGRITIDDVVDVISDEATEDYIMASGLSDSVESNDKVLSITRARIPWLLIGLAGGIVVSQVIGIYENQLALNPVLAFFIPLIGAMGGNVGVQSSAIVVQSLAHRDIPLDGLMGRLAKELKVALINAGICSVLLFAYTFLANPSPELAYTVSISLFSVIILASLFGTFIPLFLNYLKIDPALATGPFITTANDIIGLIIYFMIAKSIYGI